MGGGRGDLKQSMRDRDQGAVEILGLVLLSGALGAACGCAAALPMRSNDALLLAMTVGGGVGVATAGPFVVALSKGSRTEGVVFIALPTLLAAFLSGLMVPSHALVVSTLVCIGLCLAWIVWAPTMSKRYPAGTCDQCGYDLRGLETGSTCPECGADRRNSILEAIRSRRGDDGRE